MLDNGLTIVNTVRTTITTLQDVQLINKSRIEYFVQFTSLILRENNVSSKILPGQESYLTSRYILFLSKKRKKFKRGLKKIDIINNKCRQPPTHARQKEQSDCRSIINDLHMCLYVCDRSGCKIKIQYLNDFTLLQQLPKKLLPLHKLGQMMS